MQVKFWLDKAWLGFKFWFKQSWIAFDQFLNAFVCMGWADETMSSVAWRMEQQGHWFGFMRPVIDFLALHLFRDRDHCQGSFESERNRSQLPPEAR